MSTSTDRASNDKKSHTSTSCGANPTQKQIQTTFFPNEEMPAVENKTFSMLLAEGNKKGAVDHLRTLSKKDFSEQVLSAGFSMISFKYGMSRNIKHVAGQIKL